MGKFIKDLKVCWPSLLAAAIAVTLVSCHNEKMAEQNQKAMEINNRITFEETFVKSDFLELQDHELEEIIIPDGLDLEDTETYEDGVGFSK